MLLEDLMCPESAHYMSCSMNKSKALLWFESRAKWLVTITCGWRHTLGMGLGWEGCGNTGRRWNNGLDRSQAPVAYCVPKKGIWQLYKVISRLYLWLRAQQSWKDIIKATKISLFFRRMPSWCERLFLRWRWASGYHLVCQLSSELKFQLVHSMW